MIKVALTGAAGQMGKTLVQLIAASPDLLIQAGFEAAESSHVGEDIATVAGLKESGVEIVDLSRLLNANQPTVELQDVDVLIDFSVPDMTKAISQLAAKAKLGLVIGTTGQSAADLEAIQQVSEEIPLVMSPNMSVGVNIAFKLLEIASQAMGPEADVEIYEMHHKLKIDAPSGTAVRMGEIVAEARTKELHEVAVYGREGNTGRREMGTIGFHSARGGDVVGEHTVTFAGDGERIEITHRAQSRANFAAGALKAARFVFERRQEGKVGRFDMNQVLGLQ